MNELLPCPFCGSDKTGIGIDADHSYGYCAICQCEGPRATRGYGEEERAEQNWNKRVSKPRMIVVPCGPLRDDEDAEIECDDGA